MIRRKNAHTHKVTYYGNSNGPAPKEITKGIIISLERARETRLNPQLDNIAQNTNIPFIILDAIDGTQIENKSCMCDGALGCILSHVKAIQQAKAEGLPAALILEDDAFIVPDFDEKIKAVLRAAGDDWDAIWLGGINGDKPKRHNDLLNITTGNWSTYGYILRSTVYSYCISGLSGLRTTADCWYMKFLHPKYLCYKTKEELALHRSDLPSLVDPKKDWTKHPIHV